MTVKEILKIIRLNMINDKVDAYLVDNADYHGSEYVNKSFEERSFVSKFYGSNGILLITKEEAFLWTDGRYFLQAEKDLKETEIRLMKMSTIGYPSLKEYLESNLINKTLGFNGRCISSNFIESLDKRIKIIDDIDYVQDVWKDRPYLEFNKIWALDDKLAGEKISSKIKRLRMKMAEYEADIHILSSLTDIAWLYNLRGNDIDITPVFFAFSIISKQDLLLFVNKNALNDQAKELLSKAKVTLRDYGEFFNFIYLIKGMKVLIDKSGLNYSFVKILEENNKLINQVNPTVLMKALKNKTEIKNTKSIHLTDGLAVFRMVKYAKENFNKIPMDEIHISDKLLEYRKMDPRFFELSFETIAAFKENAAIIHYEPTKETSKKIVSDGLLLVDSGGQYYGGTTDITRTISLGSPSEEMKHHYTLTLKSLIAVSSIHFLKGVTGQNIDILARRPFWNEGLDYKHGTGHGVGYMSNVHEGPNGFRWQKVSERSDSSSLMEGMVTTIEPGIYLKDKYGIRIENELLTIKDIDTELGSFLKFETLTCAPIDLDPLNVKELTKEEKNWLNNYHKDVYKKLSKLVKEEEIASLKHFTRKV